MKWPAGLVVAALVLLTRAAPAQITVPIYLEDSHAGSFYWLAEQLDLDDPVTLVHFDAHSDASAIFDSDEVRTQLRRVGSRAERKGLLTKWRERGVVQCFNWIEPLMPSPIARVVWVRGEQAGEEDAKRGAEAGDFLDGHLEAAPRRAGSLRERISVRGLEELEQSHDLAGPLLVSIDLDYFAGVPAPERAAAFERVWKFVVERRNLRGITFAISRPYLASDDEADALVQLALEAALSLPTARIRFEPFRTLPNDQSLRAREYRAAQQEVPAFDVAQASPPLRALLLAHAEKIEVREAAPEWRKLLARWRAEGPMFHLRIGKRAPSTDGIWRVPVESADDLEVRGEPWYAVAESVEWIVQVPIYPRCNLLARTDGEIGFAHDAPPRPRWRDEIVVANATSKLPFDQLRPWFDATTGCGTVRIKARFRSEGVLRETPAIEVRRSRGSGFRAALREQFGLPYLYGSGSLRIGGETGPETGFGADCANFVVLAMRQQGLRVPWCNPKQLRKYLQPASERIAPDDIERGVILHFGNHVAALLEDRPPLGLIDAGDLVAHQLEGLPEIVTLGALMTKRATPHYEVYRVAASSDASDLLLGGDVMLGRSVGDAIASGVDPLTGIRVRLGSSANVLVNLECAIPGPAKPAAKRYTFGAPESAAKLLADAGITLVGVANNHARDFGEEGLQATLAALERNNLAVVGQNLAPRFLSTPSGQRIAVIAWNDLAAPPRAHLAEAITLGRAQSDLLVCFVHWGEENTAEVTDRQRELARWLIDAGVDLVAGAHPHCTQPLEFYRGRPILYSLGNLVFDGAPTVAAWNRGQLAQITLTGKRGAAVRLLPIQLDVRGFPYEPSARPTAGAVRSRQRVRGFSKNR